MQSPKAWFLLIFASLLSIANWQSVKMRVTLALFGIVAIHALPQNVDERRGYWLPPPLALPVLQRLPSPVPSKPVTPERNARRLGLGCDRRTLAVLNKSCTETVQECRDLNGQPLDCQEVCTPVAKNLSVPVVYGKRCLDQLHCQAFLRGCVKNRCPTVAVNSCPPNLHPAKVIANREVCTKTVSGLCSDRFKNKCDTRTKSFLECIFESAAGCRKGVVDNCVQVPVLIEEGQHLGSKCQVEKKMNCDNETVKYCNDNLSDDCKLECGRRLRLITENVTAMNCKFDCKVEANCVKIPAPSCYEVKKSFVC